MATWYVDNVLGNDSNAGTSPGAGNAFASLNKFNSLATLLSGDIIRVKATGVNYTINNPGGSSAVNFFSTNGGSIVRSIYITNYTTDTTRPVLSFTKDLVNTNGFWNYNAARTKNIDFNIDSLTDVTGFLNVVNFTSINGSTSNTVIEDCKFTYVRTGAGSNPNKTISFAYSSLKNCEFDFGLGNYTFNSINQVSQTTYNNIFKGIRATSSFVFNIYGSVMKNIFYDNTTSATNGVIFLANTATNYISFNNNTLIFNDDAAMSNNSIFMFTRFANATQLSTFGYSVFSNVLINNRTVGSTTFIGGTVNITPTAEIQAKVGNNALLNFSNIYSNITTTNFPTVSDLFQFGAFITLSENPFLSQNPASADFCKIDTTITSGQQLMGVAVYDPEIDLGVYQTVAGAGSAPNAYDLRAGVTVGAVTGTLVVPSASDVKIGIAYDAAPNAKIGTLESTDPGVANVKSGVSYKIDSTTHVGTYVAYPLLAANLVKIGTDRGDGQLGTYVAAERYTDPGATNVKTGTSYLFNNSTINGSYTAYPLLALNLVKIGQDRGDGQLGTYDASERYTDLDLSQIVSGYNFRYNSLTNNRVGTRTSIYALLALSNVKFGIDRGDGQFGTDKGEDFNSVLTADQVKVGLTIQNLGNTFVGSYTASERYSLLDATDVKDGVIFTYNNIEYTGSYLAYPLLNVNDVKFGVDRGDGQLGTDKGEDFNSVLTDSQIKIGESIQNLGNTIVGVYTALERYTFISQDKVEINFNYLYNNEEFTGTFAGGGATDYPLENVVLFPTLYAFGTKQGTLGKYNLNNLDVVTQINTSSKLIIQNTLGSEFKELKYLKEVRKNDFYNNTNCFGIRPLNDERTFDVIGKETVDVDFEIKITTDFQNRDGDDAERIQELYLIEKMEEVRRALRITKMGYIPHVRVVKGFDRSEVEKVDGQDVLVCRAIITVSYGIK